LFVDLISRWLVTLVDSLIADRGYLVAGSVAAAYLAIYGVLDAKHQREDTQASFERSTFIALVTSANPASFVVGMKSFGQVQRVEVTQSPSLFEPWSWFQRNQPNLDFLSVWARYQLSACKPLTCSSDEKWRIDLSHANLAKASLRDTELYGAYLFGAQLVGADLSHSNLSGAILNEADLSGANLSHADLSPLGKFPSSKTQVLNLKLPYADLSYADLSYANVDHADMRGANLSCARFVGANLYGVNLSNANLMGVNLGNAHISGLILTAANLTGANLTNIDLSTSEISGANFNGALYSKDTKFRKEFDPQKVGMKLEESSAAPKLDEGVADKCRP